MTPEEQKRLADMEIKLNKLDDLFYRSSQKDKFYSDKPIQAKDVNVVNINGNLQLKWTGMKVTSLGASAYNPHGYTVARSAGIPNGQYTITHNFNIGSGAYLVVATPYGSAAISAAVYSQSGNAVDIQTFDAAGTLVDSSFSVIFGRP